MPILFLGLWTNLHATGGRVTVNKIEVGASLFDDEGQEWKVEKLLGGGYDCPLVVLRPTKLIRNPFVKNATDQARG